MHQRNSLRVALALVLLAWSGVACNGTSASATDAAAATDAGAATTTLDASGTPPTRKLSTKSCQGAPPYDSDPYCLNSDCPANAPLTGPHAARGACCFREPNSLRSAEAAARGEKTVTLGYRTTYNVIVNHPKSLSLAPVMTSVVNITNRELTANLFRYEIPIDAHGKPIAGAGSVESGAGVSHCDGTFSFYTKSAAPAVAGRSADRWLPVKFPSHYDPSLPTARAEHVAWRDAANRRVSYAPNYKADGTLDYELAVQGVDFITNDQSSDLRGSSPDCNGKLVDGVWQPSVQTITYLPLRENNVDLLKTTPVPQTICQFAAFGVLLSQADASCDTTKRCKPGPGCKWVKLPDSLCPVGDAEQSLFGCHVGAADNADKAPTHCTADAPTSALDPDQGAKSEGQCCDALGESKTLPACNAFRVVSDVVLAGTQINDTGADKVVVCK